MSLKMESRPIGDVLVVQCHGKIVSGQEVLTLHHSIGDSLARHTDVVLELTDVDFVDSSGLGALVRLVQAAHAKGKDLKLTGVQPYVHKTLKMTNLISQFHIYESVEAAITASYLGSRYSHNCDSDAHPLILCIYDSFDMCTFLRELLCSAGYNALTAANVSDGRVLLKATKAKVVVLSSHLQSCHGHSTVRLLREIDPSVCIMLLDPNFANQDPGEAAEKLLASLSQHCGKQTASEQA